MTIDEFLLNWRTETIYGDSPKTKHKRCILLIKPDNKTYHRSGMNMESTKHSYICNKIRNYVKIHYHKNPTKIAATLSINSCQKSSTIVFSDQYNNNQLVKWVKKWNIYTWNNFSQPHRSNPWVVELIHKILNWKPKM